MSILNVDKIQPIGGGSTITVDATDIQASTGTIRASTFSGDVSATGIGVTILNVTGISTFTNELQISPSNSSSYVTHLNFNNTGTNFISHANSGGTFFRNSTSGQTAVIIQGSNNAVDVNAQIRHLDDTDTLMEFGDNIISFDTAGDERLRITSDGNVLIGTQTTAGKLTVDTGGNTTAGYICITSAGGGRLRLGYAFTSGPSNDQFAEILTDTNGDLDIATRGNNSSQIKLFTSTGSGSEERLRITSGGHVNIGGSYTQTSKTLYVDGTIEATSNFTCTNQIYLNGTAPQIVFTDTNQDSDYTIKNDFGSLQFIDRTNSNAIRMYANTGGFGGDRLYIANDIVHTGDTDTKIEFDDNTINFDTAGGERLRITSNGYIVLGHTAANARLHIASGTSNAVGDGTNPAFQIGATANYRFGIYTDGETAFFYNKNGDDGFHFLTKTTSGGNATKFKIHKDQVYGVDDYADTGTGQRDSSQAHPTGVIEWQNNTDNGINRYNIYIQATGGNERDMYITIRNGGFYRITIKASHNSTSADVAQYLIYGLNSRATANKIVEVVDSGNFTCTDHNTHVNTYDSTVKINYSGSANQGLRALVETIGGF